MVDHFISLTASYFKICWVLSLICSIHLSRLWHCRDGFNSISAINQPDRLCKFLESDILKKL